MGDIVNFLHQVKNNPEITKQAFNPHFLSNAGIILENRGFEEAKLFLWDSHFTEDLEQQSLVLMKMLSEMEDLDMFRKNRVLAGYLIKNIHKIQK